MDNIREAHLQSFILLLSQGQKSISNKTVPTPQREIHSFFGEREGAVAPCRPCCSLPSLNLLQESLCRKSKGSLELNHNKRRLQESCAEKMSAPSRYTYQNVSDAPTDLAENISRSFSYLVKSRLASSIKAFVGQSSVSRIHKNVFVKSLTKSSVKPVILVTVKTLFQPIPNSSTIAGSVSSRENVDTGSDLNRISDSSLALMMNFSVTMHFCIMGETPFSVRLKVPGRCSDVSDDSTSESSHFLTHASVVLDTELLLQQMMTQARLVAKKALEIAADSAQFYIAGLSSSNVSLVSMSSSEGSNLSQLANEDKDRDNCRDRMCANSRLDTDSMQPPPPRRPRPHSSR